MLILLFAWEYVITLHGKWFVISEDWSNFKKQSARYLYYVSSWTLNVACRNGGGGFANSTKKSYWEKQTTTNIFDWV